ncbi:MAG: 2-oxoglutarate carboxylase large subunit [Lentisphaerae bacterium ADurb.BinA184]|nr:MAG: 2-oxoglutarate carboxylase large subunit [Lentisphaerae bacterium ADurb.BinA184]
MMKKIGFMDLSFRDGFQSVYGARVKTADFLPALEAAVAAGCRHFEIGGGARFQSLYFYCQEDAFDMMDRARQAAGPEVDLQTLARGVNVVGLSAQSRDVIDLHAKLFKKHGVTTIRNFDALNDVRNLDFSGRCIHRHGLKHQVAVTLMALPPGMADTYPHSAEYYRDCVRQILESGLPFDSLCFKDASGTTTPRIVHDTVRYARQLLPAGTIIHFHTHCTAGIGVDCNLAAIEAGADVIDLAMDPVSGGTGAVDILVMWHALRGTDYTLDVDYEKILEAEEVFKECMDTYFMPPEAKETSPLIVLSPMPGGALTANTQMMRDQKCLHLYPQVIKAMREVVARGGYGTSVTPVSQFYFQQAFANVTQGAWKTMTEGYGKMVLGYFGRTPTAADPEIVRLASEKLGLPATTEDPADINDRDPKLGLAAARAVLRREGLPETEENQFIVACCEGKGVAFLKGEAPLGIRYKTPAAPVAAAPAAKAPAAAPAADAGVYTVRVDGRAFVVHVSAGGEADVHAQTPAAAPVAPTVPAGSGNGAHPIKAPMPGTVIRLLAKPGDAVQKDDLLCIIEAMKMEQPIRAVAAGTVRSLAVKVGDTLEAGQVVAMIG